MQRTYIQRGCSLSHRLARLAAWLQVTLCPGNSPEVCRSVLPLLTGTALLFAGPRSPVISIIGLDSCAGILLTIGSAALCLSISRLHALQILVPLQYHGATCRTSNVTLHMSHFMEPHVTLPLSCPNVMWPKSLVLSLTCARVYS